MYARTREEISRLFATAIALKCDLRNHSHQDFHCTFATQSAAPRRSSAATMSRRFTTYSATEQGEARQEAEWFRFDGVRTGSRRCADWRREWYSTPSQAVRMREIRAHLTAKMHHEAGAAREPKRQSASCNGGQYRLRKPNTPLRKEVERETGDPEGNLVIVERVAHERQRLFSCREYGWDGTAHRFASTAQNGP